MKKNKNNQNLPHEINKNSKYVEVFWNRLCMWKMCQLLLHVLTRYITLIRKVLTKEEELYEMKAI